MALQMSLKIKCLAPERGTRSTGNTMNAKRRYFLWLFGAALLTAGACGTQETPDAKIASHDNDQELFGYTALYERLAEGDCLYVGTVAKTLPEPSRRYTEQGWQQVEEKGELHFQVEQTLFGPSVPELRIHYVYSRQDNEVASDWGGHTWDNHPPKRGMRLALLVHGEANVLKYPEGVKEEGPVVAIWPAPPGDPFIQDLTAACRFLAPSEPKERIGLVKDPIGLVQSVGGSKFPTLKYFVRAAVFGPEDAKRFPEPEIKAASPEVILEFMRAAGPAVKKDDERAKDTGSLGLWFRVPGHAKAAPEELRSAFEDWYLADLEARNKGERTVSALYGLQALCKAIGVQETVGLFRQAGQAGLVQRVEACANTPQEESQERVQKLAHELLDLLNGKS
jgi:hypothetical protein